jgi:type III secretion protein F
MAINSIDALDAPVEPPAVNNGFLTHMSKYFEQGSLDANKALTEALAKLTKDPSNPALLSQYQSALSQYTLYRNAQSSVVKAYKDVGAAIIANYR